jgi:transposase
MARKRIRLRTLTTEEETEIRRLARSRKEPMRLVQRAGLIEALYDEPNLNATEAGLQAGFKSSGSGVAWVRRFNEEGLAGLEDKPRGGRPATHSEAVRSRVIDLALQKPFMLGLPFQLWTVSRLQTEYEERYGLHLSTSTIWEWVKAEGLDWKRQQSWFHEAEKHDPEFVEKRGPSSVHMSGHQNEPG